MREEIEKNTDRAWNGLYDRLKQDGLLADAVREQRTAGWPDTAKWIAGAAALLAGAISLFLWLDPNTPSATDTLVLDNGKGEPTLVATFEDGSIIYLNEQASVEYPSHFAQDKREVSLRGSAFFEVSENRERPFIIHTRTTTIEVLGTSFNVKSEEDDSFSLAVRTGKVKVTSGKDGRSVYVAAGETASLRTAGLRVTPTRDTGQFNACLRYIHFKDQTLADVARIINENTDSVQLKVAPELGDRRVTVTFRDNTPEDMARILCAGLELELNRQQNILYINREN